MGLGGVEINAVALFQDDGLAGDVQLHLAFQHHVELLAGVGVLIDGPGSRLGFNGDDEHVGLVVHETTHQRLVLVGLGAFDGQSLSFAGHIV